MIDAFDALVELRYGNGNGIHESIQHKGSTLKHESRWSDVVSLGAGIAGIAI